MPHDTKTSVIVADSCWHSTRNLLETWPPASAPDARLLRLEPIDWRNALARGKRPWRWGIHHEQVGSLVSVVEAELPPGWMKSFPALGQWPLARACRKWRKMAVPADAAISLWITYPFYLALAQQVEPASLIYYNLDDYSLYWPARADAVRAWEARAVARADWTVCVAAERARQLRQAFPDRAGRILHLPHGAPEATIPAEPFLTHGPPPPEFAHIPRPWLGYLGGLEDRVDWPLLQKVAESFPEASVVLIGPRPKLEGQETWHAAARKTLSLPNVYAAGPVEQGRIAETYASFDVNMIPYDATHPFNVACSPTKLMDAMGCGRPAVATDLPECRVHDGLYEIARNHDDFLHRLGRSIASGFRDGLEHDRWRFARNHSSRIVLDKLFRLTMADSSKLADGVLAPESPIG